MTHPNEFATCGRFAFYWDIDEQCVALFVDDQEFRCFDEQGTLSNLEEVLEAYHDKMDVTDVVFLTACFQCIETWLDHAPYDMAKYGEVGVSF